VQRAWWFKQADDERERIERSDIVGQYTCLFLYYVSIYEIEGTIIEQETLTDHWWATGDMPVRNVPSLAFLIDGRMTMLEMCLSFLGARHSIYITAFGLSPELLLVRGKHKSVGSTGSPEQEELLLWLHAKGLSQEELLFWQHCDELNVTNVLSRAVSKGVDVRVLLWDTYPLPSQPTPNPKNVQDFLESLGMRCLLDDSHKGLLNHPLMAHHQKTAVVDSRLAFVGGIDMMVENNGDFDRWDTRGHPYHTPLRPGKEGQMPHNWHDVHVLFEGPAVADVVRNFRQRWNAIVELQQQDPSLLLPEPPHSSPWLPLTPIILQVQGMRFVCK
jgi:phosphatidylserine/phosphatidylglycerophosphate/cardiolipin synthase-like enzyme